MPSPDLATMLQSKRAKCSVLIQFNVTALTACSASSAGRCCHMTSVKKYQCDCVKQAFAIENANNWLGVFRNA